MIQIKKHQTKGRLIAVEGLDGSGKSTQVYLLKRWLELEGYKVFFTEWNSSVLVKNATRKGKKSQLLTPSTFSLIHCTDFADRYERQIWPLLCAGYIVLADRYFFTAFARDAARGCNPQWVRTLYSFASQPDITFFFRVPPEIAISRILKGRPALKYHEAGMDLGLSNDPYESFRIFQGMINQGYVDMIDEFGFTAIDAAQSIDQQQRFVRQIVAEKIDLPSYKWRVRIRI
jgi:dTMP kinase